MNLFELGYNEKVKAGGRQGVPDNLVHGRVIAEHKERYIVGTASGEYEAEITGNMRFSAGSREDYPAVGDWVNLMIYDDHSAIIHSILPRYSLLKRLAVGKKGDIQVIAANIDYAFIMQAVDRDYNPNRMERYLTLCNASGVKPLILLSKIDLISENRLHEMVLHLKERIPEVPVLKVSNESKAGYAELNKHIIKGRTYCLLGSSGVGKSTLLNNLARKDMMRTGSLSSSTNKGKHITSHRELIILPDGGILIDNPGMREVGIADEENGLERTFGLIEDLSKDCKYADCRHTHEKGCAVIAAVEKGEIERASYENYLKLEREKAHYGSTAAEKKKKDKTFGKLMKNYKKDVKRNDL